MSFYASRLIYQRIVVVCTFAFAACSAFASELTIVTEELPPLNYESQGVVTGYSTELLEAVLWEAKIKSTVNILPWARAYQMATTQPNTLIFSTARTPDREDFFEWIGPISSRQIYLFKLKSRTDIDVKTVTDSFQYKIGLIREMASGKTFLKNNNVPDSTIDYAPTAESNLKKLLVGRIDLIISLDWSAAYQMKKEKRDPSELEPVLVLDDKTSYYFALNKQSDPVLVQKIRKAFEKVKKSGLMDRLRNKYMH
ncbi:substrate-binding periplasmic protein [Undibacterium sp. Ji67W]|uniref:substrate-binding periplasmic protein n=1 Tax=Undibacterium sp. Ji67W TaxID=3413042 RepID=UPI003BEFBA92